MKKIYITPVVEKIILSHDIMQGTISVVNGSGSGAGDNNKPNDVF